jgi:hypothetical protein
MILMPNRNRRSLGTTLIEILVVIVVFLVGILAVVQIFPKGFQILSAVRDRMSATAMAEDMETKLTAQPDSLPEMILPIDADSGNSDGTIPTGYLGFFGLGITSAGTATSPSGSTLDPNGSTINWEYLTGYNSLRRIIGESQVIPSPTLVGQTPGFYGGMIALRFGPISLYAPNGAPAPLNLVAYGNDLTQNPWNSSLFGNSFTQSGLQFYPAQSTLADYEYYVQDPAQQVATVYLPTGGEPNGRAYRISFDAYLMVNGNPVKESFATAANAPFFVSQQTIQPGTGQYPWVALPLQSVAGVSLLSVDPSTIRIQRQFRYIPKGSLFSTSDPFEFKILDPALGTLLFNPLGYNLSISVPGMPRQALKAHVNYDVLDWRILHDDFRVDGDEPSTHQLPLLGLRTNTQANVDGTANTAGPQGFSFEQYPSDASGSDHFILLDLVTGGTFYEVAPSMAANPGQRLITVDKSRGTVDFADADPSQPGMQGWLYLPDGSSIEVNMAGRSVRALFQSNKEWAVQVLKAAALYHETIAAPSVGQFYVGGTSPTVGGRPTRIYFPVCDAGRKVNVGQIFYIDNNGNKQTAFGQDFVIHAASPTDPVFPKMPYIDITDTLPAQSVDAVTYGYAAKDVKGASVMVRAIWNPDTFKLSSSSTQNVTAQATWSQSWRTATAETYLDLGVSSR